METFQEVDTGLDRDNHVDLSDRELNLGQTNMTTKSANEVSLTMIYQSYETISRKGSWKHSLLSTNGSQT